MAYVTYYNRWHQSINCTSIEILIKINLEIALKLNSLDIFFDKVGQVEAHEILYLREEPRFQKKCPWHLILRLFRDLF